MELAFRTPSALVVSAGIGAGHVGARRRCGLPVDTRLALVDAAVHDLTAATDALPVVA